MVDPDPEVLWAIKGDLATVWRQLSDAASGLRRNGFGDVETVEESKECMTLFVVEQQRSNMTGMQFLLAAWNCSKLSEFAHGLWHQRCHSGSVAKKRWLSDRDILARFFKNTTFTKRFPMPGKRSKHKNVQRFYCPYCERRLWRLGSPKHYLFYLGASEIKKNVSMSRQSAELLASKGAYVDSGSWIEFFCGDHGKLWMKVTRRLAV